MIPTRKWLWFILMLIGTCVRIGSGQDYHSDGDNRFLVTKYHSGPRARNHTSMFQSAIDSCTVAGGGTVVVPAGNYILGRVFLKDNVTLRLEPGAVLQPSTEKADYPPIAGSPNSHYQSKNAENALNSRYAILYAFGAKNISICGGGKINGLGKAFWQVKNTGDFEKYRTVAPWHYYTPNPFRPILVLFEECENAKVADLLFEDAPCYGGWFAGCRNMHFSRATIINDLSGPNTDGFHFSSCHNVHITGCHFECGDDCIAIDPNHNGPSANFTVTGCTFHTTVNIFRIYTGLDPGLPKAMPRGLVSDISAANCSVENASGVFNVTADDGDIRRLTFTNFTIQMNLRGSAFFFLTLKGGTLEDIFLTDMAISTDGLGVISGEKGKTIAGISLDGLRYRATPRSKLYGNGMPDPLLNWGMHHFAPYNLYIRHARDIRIRNVSVDWGEADLGDLDKIAGSCPYWSCVECIDVERLDLEGLTCLPFGSKAPAVQLIDTKAVRISQCRVPEKIATFLALAGSCGNIRLQGNDFSQVGKIFVVANGLEPDYVLIDEFSKKK